MPNKGILSKTLKESSSRRETGCCDIHSLHWCKFVLQVENEDSIELYKEQIATMTFTNPFAYPVGGVLTIAGAGLIQDKVHLR